MKLVIIGCPGAGKGTQAELLAEHFGIAHISTGDLLREEIHEKTEIGLKIIDIMDSGELVPDDIVTTLLSKRIKKDDCKKGYILDGYPRDVSQAETLNNIAGEIDKVILIVVEDDKIIERMAGRRSCSHCSHMYHIKHNPPKTDGVCDFCGSELVQRKDDNEETVKNRLEVYHSTTAPVISYYRDKGVVMEFNGEGEIEEISEKIISALEHLA